MGPSVGPALFLEWVDHRNHSPVRKSNLVRRWLNPLLCWQGPPSPKNGYQCDLGHTVAPALCDAVRIYIRSPSPRRSIEHTTLPNPADTSRLGKRGDRPGERPAFLAACPGSRRDRALASKRCGALLRAIQGLVIGVSTEVIGTSRFGPSMGTCLPDSHPLGRTQNNA